MNSDEFKKMVLPYGKKLFHFARFLLKDEYLAQDAVQEVYIRLWNMRKELAKIGNMEAFAIKITKNWCLDRMKSKKPVFIEDYSAGFDQQKDVSEPDRMLERNEKIRNLYAILETLPEQQKILIKLRDIDGYNSDEIAEITGLNEVTIRVNLSRARKRIREEIMKIESYGFKKSGNIN
ncbi:MAG TPA: RNA polymerase sigma factor [Bacteroidales bacterium]|nr:RNA polymerase sigma factor [Bacteroidales bacterium]